MYRDGSLARRGQSLSECNVAVHVEGGEPSDCAIRCTSNAMERDVLRQPMRTEKAEHVRDRGL
jgi:hypothetical protein